MERWAGRVALITGASSGIGASVARKLAEHGMKVVGCSRNTDATQKSAEELESKGLKGSLTPIKCDVSKEEEVLSMFSQIKSKFGGVDVCINSAGLAHVSPLLSGATGDWKHMLEVNVLGPCICTRETIKSMKDRNVDDGHIFILNSMSGHRVVNNAGGHFYSATKFAVTALVEGIRNELRTMKSHIRVTGVSPGLVETEFHERMVDRQLADNIYSAQKCLQADDIADSIIYALQAPPHVQVHDILMRPTEQVV